MAADQRQEGGKRPVLSLDMVFGASIGVSLGAAFGVAFAQVTVGAALGIGGC